MLGTKYKGWLNTVLNDLFDSHGLYWENTWHLDWWYKSNNEPKSLIQIKAGTSNHAGGQVTYLQ